MKNDLKKIIWTVSSIRIKGKYEFKYSGLVKLANAKTTSSMSRNSKGTFYMIKTYSDKGVTKSL